MTLIECHVWSSNVLKYGPDVFILAYIPRQMRKKITVYVKLNDLLFLGTDQRFLLPQQSSPDTLDRKHSQLPLWAHYKWQSIRKIVEFSIFCLWRWDFQSWFYCWSWWSIYLFLNYNHQTFGLLQNIEGILYTYVGVGRTKNFGAFVIAANI